jgi:hypothetical protein
MVKRAAATAVMVAALAAPGTAWAQANDYTGSPPAVVSADSDSRPVVLGDTQTPRAESDNLPFTGADIAQFTVVGLSALGAGFALRRRSRRIA